MLSPFPHFIGFALASSFSNSDVILHVDEIKHAATYSSAKRRADFTNGRKALRLAAAQINLPLAAPILPSQKRYPAWPKGVVGCITHCIDFAAAAISTDPRVAGIGIDIETATRQYNYDVEKRILKGEERCWVDSEPALRTQRVLQVFSAKECLYKALNPLCGVSLGFQDVLCDWSCASQSFNCEILKPIESPYNLPSSLKIGSKIESGLILSSLVVYKD